MGAIIDKITEFIKEMLQGWVLDNLSTMFTDVNDKVGTIAGEVGKTPSSWNSGIFSMIQSLSENVMVPIAGIDVYKRQPQDFGYYPDFNGMDFLLYMASLKGLTKTEDVYKRQPISNETPFLNALSA